jgi:hypothetical protein
MQTDSSDISGFIFQGIEVDPLLPFPKQIIPYSPVLAGIQKNISWQQEIQKFLTEVSPHFRNRSICTNQWGVAVDITREVFEAANQLSNWCIVIVVGEQQCPDKVNENVFLLNKTIRYQLAKISAFYKESLLLPNDRYTLLKNLGYLWAIFHEATIIWDFDLIDDLIVNRSALLPSLNETVEAINVLNYNHTLFNPHSFFKSNWEPVWSRGYPFKSINVSF